MQAAATAVGGLRSGATVPEFFVAHVDVYGQIVVDFNSKVRVDINQNSYK